MRSKWPVDKIAQHAEVFSGFAFKSSDLNEDEGIPVVKIKNVNNRVVDISETQFFPEDLITYKHQKFFLKNGDVLIAMTGQGSVGRVGRLSIDSDRKVLLNQRVGKFVPLPSLNIRYFYYVASSEYYESIFFNAGLGSGQPNLSPDVIKNIEVPIPPLSEQKSIAHILGTLDDKIELNRQMNATLESMAQALFKSWFVDFDPVIDNALAAGNPIPEPLQARADMRKALGDNGAGEHLGSSDKGDRSASAKQGASQQRKPLPENIRQQFPNRFVFSEEMGWVPEGWEVGPISLLAELNSEGWTPKDHPESVLYVDLANAKNGRINERVYYSFSEAPSRARRALRKDDSIIGTVRPGNRSFAFIQEDGLTGSTGFAVMRPQKPCYRSFVYLSLTRNDVIDKFAHLADGAAYPAIRSEVVANQVMVYPSDLLLEMFDELLYPWLTTIGMNESVSDSLSQTRDTLLPKLLSGQLRIPEAEQQVAAAL